jgi:diadenylate cyclase
MNLNYEEIVRACKRMSQNKSGALIALAKTSVLLSYQRTGVIIDAEVSSLLLQNIFMKNSPLHDGAVIISNNRISAASCIFPVSENQDLPQQLGLRHRAALGMSEISDAIIITVSEENGHISYFSEGRMLYNISPERMRILLEKSFITTELH